MVDAIINVKSFNPNMQPHIVSIYKEGIWGFSKRYNNSWKKLEKGTRLLLYGDGEIRIAGTIEETYFSDEPIKYWTDNPTGYPLLIKIKLLNKITDETKTINRDELVDKYNIALAKKGFMGHQICYFGIGGKYTTENFEKIWSEFLKENCVKFD